MNAQADALVCHIEIVHIQAFPEETLTYGYIITGNRGYDPPETRTVLGMLSRLNECLVARSAHRAVCYTVHWALVDM